MWLCYYQISIIFNFLNFLNILFHHLIIFINNYLILMNIIHFILIAILIHQILVVIFWFIKGKIIILRWNIYSLILIIRHKNLRIKNRYLFLSDQNVIRYPLIAGHWIFYLIIVNIYVLCNILNIIIKYWRNIWIYELIINIIQ